MTACCFPSCPIPADRHNRAGQDVCRGHVAVVVGRDVPDAHDRSEAMD